VIGRYSPRECAVESVYFGTNAKTAFATGQARGVAVLATADAGLVLGEYGPGEIKMAVVGSGSADKGQVQYMVRTILGLDQEPSPDHAADALAAAICHAHSRLTPVGTGRPRR
jgi:crossover junction endodeoxyribonuclease RuvC